MLEKTSQGETTLFGNRFWGQPGCRLQDFLQLSLRLLVPADATLSQKNPLLVTVATSTPTTRMSISGSFQPLLEDFPCTQLDSPNPHSIARKVLAPRLSTCPARSCSQHSNQVLGSDVRAPAVPAHIPASLHGTMRCGSRSWPGSVLPFTTVEAINGSTAVTWLIIKNSTGRGVKTCKDMNTQQQSG